MKQSIATIRRIITDKGIVLVLLAGTLLTFLFFGKLVLHPNSTYFQTEGDGLQVYYQLLYHLKHDISWWHQSSMNYPDGDAIFFTGAPPIFTNMLRLLGIENWGIGAFNLLQLFSPLLGAIFLYALFRHLRLKWWYGALSALGIMFASPQIVRMAGHYSLAISFLIPALIYALVRFYDYPRFRLSLLIGLLAFFAGGMHLYLLIFCLITTGIYWLVLFITRDRGFGRIRFVLKHLSIQLILPVLILQLLIRFSDNVSDRTQYPSGFADARSSWEAILYPHEHSYEPLAYLLYQPYESADDRLTHISRIHEGLAYIGIVGIATILVIVLVQLWRLLHRRFRWVLIITDKKVLNILCWTSLLLLLYAFGWPFALGHEDWVNHISIVRQFRSVGRFAWLFYYMISIIGVYRIWKLVEHRQGKFGHVVRNGVLLFIPSILLFDAWDRTRLLSPRLANTIPALEDVSNQLPENSWLQNFSVKNYQAILPLPYFHNSSEHITIRPPGSEIILAAYTISLKTGLPLLAENSSRSSIHKAIEHAQLVYDPLRPLSLLNRLPNKLPFLVIARPNELNTNERELWALCKEIHHGEKYSVAELLPERINERIKNQYAQHLLSYQSQPTFDISPFQSTDSTRSFVWMDFENLSSGSGYNSSRALVGKAGEYLSIYEDRLPGGDTSAGTISFWFNHFNKDCFPRTTIEICVCTGDSEKCDLYYWRSVSEHIIAIDGDWALVEIPLQLQHPDQRLKIRIFNFSLNKNELLSIDNFLWKTNRTQLYQKSEHSILHNNRLYKNLQP